MGSIQEEVAVEPDAVWEDGVKVWLEGYSGLIGLPVVCLAWALEDGEGLALEDGLFEGELVAGRKRCGDVEEEEGVGLRGEGAVFGDVCGGELDAFAKDFCEHFGHAVLEDGRLCKAAPVDDEGDGFDLWRSEVGDGFGEEVFEVIGGADFGDGFGLIFVEDGETLEDEADAALRIVSLRDGDFSQSETFGHLFVEFGFGVNDLEGEFSVGVCLKLGEDVARFLGEVVFWRGDIIGEEDLDVGGGLEVLEELDGGRAQGELFGLCEIPSPGDGIGKNGIEGDKQHGEEGQNEGRISKKLCAGEVGWVWCMRFHPFHNLSSSHLLGLLMIYSAIRL